MYLLKYMVTIFHMKKVRKNISIHCCINNNKITCNEHRSCILRTQTFVIITFS